MSSPRSYKLTNSSILGSTSGSNPFLNAVNPVGRTYQGYTQASQSPVPEEDETRNSPDEDADLEAGRRNRSTLTGRSQGNSGTRAVGGDVLSTRNTTQKSLDKRRVSFDAGASELHILHPNIKRDDYLHENDSSDEEVPADLMVEAGGSSAAQRLLAARSKASRVGFGKGKAKEVERTGEHIELSQSHRSQKRAQPLLSTHNSGKRLPPTSLLPTTANDPLPAVSIPPRPSELDPDPDLGTIPRRSSKGRRMGSDSTQRSGSRPSNANVGLDAYERALWNWVNVYNLDAFLQEVYFYYEGKGLYSIALSRALNLLTVGFVIVFSTFLLGCVNYSGIRHDQHTRLSEVIVDRCVSKFSGFTFMFFVLFSAFYVWQIVDFALGVRRLVDIYNFYTHLLKIPDEDIQTISWPEVVRRIGNIREENPLTAISSKNAHNNNDTTKAKLDAHDVANRIMRQENYLIALFNKEVLDLRVPLPGFLKRFVTEEEGKGKILTRALEWNLRYCLMEYLFDGQGRVRKVFLKSKNRRILIEGLQRRFIFMGILNAIFAPFIVLYILMYSFFRYFEQYHKDPSSIGGRRYTSFARWKFREFNELPHFFARRLDASYELANMYLGHFPNAKMAIIMRFVAFISGSFVAVLFLATVMDPEAFLLFEITPHKTIVFYLGVFGAILTVARGMIPEDNRVYDPELLMTGIIECTHFMPDEWKEHLHSKKVHQEFGELFAMKIVIFVQELLSVVLTPFVLWLSLPNCAPAIVDFFHEFTLHVDGLGYICSFAEFNFERHGNVKFGAPTQTNDQNMVSNQGKMEKSFINFKVLNPEWNPSDPSGSLYLSRIAHAYPHLGRRLHANPSLDSNHSTETKPDTSPADKSQDYDRALRQSQLIATSRRRGFGGSVMGMGMSTYHPSSSSIFGPFGGIAMAQTTVLGDSQGSVHVEANPPAKAHVQQLSSSQGKKGKDILPEDLAPDGTVRGGLGGSYVDGAKNEHVHLDEDEDDGLEDPGILGLMAQIYGRRDATGVLR